MISASLIGSVMIIRNAAVLEAIGNSRPFEKARNSFIHALSTVTARARN
jgi:hypothetical protein